MSHCLQINQLIALFRRQCKKLDIFVNQQMLTLFEIIAHHGTYNLLYTLLSMLNMGGCLISVLISDISLNHLPWRWNNKDLFLNDAVNWNLWFFQVHHIFFPQKKWFMQFKYWCDNLIIPYHRLMFHKFNDFLILQSISLSQRLIL